jgi:hypothetical protein
MENQTTQEVPAEVRSSEFGCCNCLWYCIECNGGSRYQAAEMYEGHPTCGNYTFYD